MIRVLSVFLSLRVDYEGYYSLGKDAIEFCTNLPTFLRDLPLELQGGNFRHQVCLKR